MSCSYNLNLDYCFECIACCILCQSHVWCKSFYWNYGTFNYWSSPL